MKTYEPIDSNIKVAFIGLGTMGYPMAGHLAKAGAQVSVYNRTKEKAEKWCQTFNGSMALSPKEAAQEADIVFTCVGNDNDLRSVVYGDTGVFAGMKKGAVLWDDTTDSAIIAKELYAYAKQHGFNFVDAPVSGGQAGAENGCLSVMCGGDAEVIDRSVPIVKAFASNIERIGEAGSGQLAKMCNQICIAGILQSLSEALAFGMSENLDMDKVLKAIGGGAAGSWQMQNRGKTMVEGKFDFGFAVDWMRKDLGLCLEEAKLNGSQLPLTALIDQFYSKVQSMGLGRADTSSLITLLKSSK